MLNFKFCVLPKWMILFMTIFSGSLYLQTFNVTNPYLEFVFLFLCVSKLIQLSKNWNFWFWKMQNSWPIEREKDNQPSRLLTHYIRLFLIYFCSFTSLARIFSYRWLRLSNETKRRICNKIFSWLPNTWGGGIVITTTLQTTFELK